MSQYWLYSEEEDEEEEETPRTLAASVYVLIGGDGKGFGIVIYLDLLWPGPTHMGLS